MVNRAGAPFHGSLAAPRLIDDFHHSRDRPMVRSVGVTHDNALIKGIRYCLQGRNHAFGAILRVLREFFVFWITQGLITGRHSWLCAVVAKKRATT